MQKDNLKHETPTDANNVLGEGLLRYYVRFRNVPPEMMFTPTYLIGIDHIQVDAKKDATEWDLKIAICRELDNLNYRPDDIRIESSQPFA
jgi:hypothetical protein